MKEIYKNQKGEEMKMKRRRDEERARDIRSMKREREREEIFSYKDKDKRAETHTSSSSSSTLILGPREAVRFSVTMATNPWPKKQRIVGRFSFFFFFWSPLSWTRMGTKSAS